MTRKKNLDLDGFDFDQFQKETVEKLKEGEPLLGKDGLLTPLIKQVLESALESEIEEHLDGDTEDDNRRNGRSRKTLKTSAGALELETLPHTTPPLHKIQ